MIVLFTDFGGTTPMSGQVKARLAEHAPDQQVVDLLHQAPDYNAHAGAHLLAAFAPTFPPGSVFMCVVDPGVGTARDGVVVMAGGHWFVGPDNGLLSFAAARNATPRLWRITGNRKPFGNLSWPRHIRADCRLIAKRRISCRQAGPAGKLHVEFDAGDLPRVIYIDHYGNAWTGVRGALQKPPA